MPRFHLTLLLCLSCSLAWPAGAVAAGGPAPRQAPSGTVAPHDLPPEGAVAARSAPATWIVGAGVTAATRRVARRFAAREVAAGILVVPRARARALAGALRAAGTYRFAEPNRRMTGAQAPAGGDDVAATDWRGFLLPDSLSPPDIAGAPLTAVIDSAADVGHPDLAGMRASGLREVGDVHGTAVASLVAGRADGAGMVGVFPGAPVLAIGTALDTASVIAAIGEALEARARVINLSLGGPTASYALFVQVARAASQNVLVVASAGNDRFTELPDGTQNPVMFPAAFPHVMSVASMGPSGASSDFSTANGAVDVAAPGESVLAAVPVAFDEDGTPDGYMRLAGTSFAAPIVSGAAAWLMAARPGLRASQSGDLLRRTARDLGDRGWDEDSGYGMIDLAAALEERSPRIDTLEVNDDIEWVDGTRFQRPDPFLFRSGHRRRGIVAMVDAWKDPSDVYRVEVPGRTRVRVTLRPRPDADPDLALFSGRARTIYRRTGRLAMSVRGRGRTDSLTIANRGRRAVRRYVVVFAPGGDETRLDAPYTLTLERVRR